jgi:hypothetical protein
MRTRLRNDLIVSHLERPAFSALNNFLYLTQLVMRNPVVLWFWHIS